MRTTLGALLCASSLTTGICGQRALQETDLSKTGVRVPVDPSVQNLGVLTPTHSLSRWLGRAYVTELRTAVNASDTTIAVKGLPKGVAPGDLWVVIDPFTIDCEIRSVNGINGLTLTVSGVEYPHGANDPVLFVTRPAANVKWFGAKGDGPPPTGVDDSTAINRALRQIDLMGGGTLYFPPGDYAIESTTLEYNATNSGLVIQGSGRTGSSSASTNASWGCVIRGSSAGAIFDFVGADRVIMRDIAIGTYGNNLGCAFTGTCKVGILLGRTGAFSGSNFSAENVSLTGYFTYGVYDINCEVVSWSHCELITLACNSWCYYTSTDNDKAIVSSAGPLLQSQDNATNTVKAFDASTSFLNYGMNGVGLGFYGRTRTVNLYGSYIAVPGGGKCIELNRSTNQADNLGPVNVMGVQFEGNTGYGIYVGDFNCSHLRVTDCLFGLNPPIAGGEIYQEILTDSSYALRHARIRNNTYQGSPNITLHRAVDSEIGEATVAIDSRSAGTGISRGCLFINAAPSWPDGYDIDSTFAGRVGKTSYPDYRTLLRAPRISLGNSAAENSPIAVAAPLVILGGTVTATKSVHFVAPEGGSSPDDLHTINGGEAGDFLVLIPVTGATVVLRDNTGNLRLSGDLQLDNSSDRVLLISDGVEWYEITNSDND